MKARQNTTIRLRVVGRTKKTKRSNVKLGETTEVDATDRARCKSDENSGRATSMELPYVWVQGRASPSTAVNPTVHQGYSLGISLAVRKMLLQ